MATSNSPSATSPSPSRTRRVGLLAGPLAAVAAWMALWWFTEAVPMAWTALLPLLLFPALGVFDTPSLPASLGLAAL